ncbi:MAG TPA: hypothetical protein VF178_05610 [Gemmatimonadaceae bacterium]
MHPGRRGAVLLALSWAAACAGGEPESHAESVGGLTVIVAAGGLIVNDTVAAGWRRIQLRGTTGDDHNVVVFRIPDGMSPEAFVAAIDTAAATPLGAVALGGPDGASTDAVVHLQPGTHLVACLIRIDDGPRHASAGEWALVHVVPAVPSGTHVAAPRATIDVDLRDFTYGVSDPWPAGAQVIRVRNTGVQDHLMLFARLHGGRTLRDWIDAEDPATVSEPPLGIARLGPGQEAYLPVDLAPGAYVLYCLVRDPGTARLHTALGMIRVVTVSLRDQ